MTTSVLVQGWRGISHSYAMVNQYQLLELLNYDDLALHHEDLPFFRAEWDAARPASGFDSERRQRLEQIPSGAGIAADITYRIAFPFRFYGGASRRIFCFGTAEHQSLSRDMIYEGPETAQSHANDAIEIVTPSRWSREGFLRHGIPESRIHVVPHGVDPAIFRPPSVEERADARRALGLPEAAFVFLNVGAMTANKGIDLLIRAFEVVHRKHRDSVLLLKDSRTLFSTKADTVIAETFASYGLNPAARRAIGVIPANFALADLRSLYGAADAYV